MDLSDLALPLASDAGHILPRPRTGVTFIRKEYPLKLQHVALIILIVAIAARWVVFGNPLVHIDEEFYLLVGSRMLHGAIPYVDIWDRKPIGLFLIFAAARSLGGNGVLEYQIAALFFVCATSLVIFTMARRIAGGAGGLFAALLYVLYLNLAGGEAGQAPVWYNLPVAAAIAIIFFARELTTTQAGDFRRPGIESMLLFGVALQIKYSAVFEGLFAGVALIAMSRTRGRRLTLLITDSALWIGCALAPTLIAAGVYAAMGHFNEWLFANFISIAERGAEAPSLIRWRVAELAMILFPLVAAIPLRRWTGAAPDSSDMREDLRFLDAWAACSLLGLVLFGTWFNHYALPTFVPLTVTAARLTVVRAGRAYACLLLFGTALWGQHILHRHQVTRGDRALLASVTTTLHGHRNCVFVYDGLVAAYDSTNSCLPTTHMFPAHLTGKIESGATGIDQEKTVATVMAGRPDRVTSMEPAYAGENLAARAVLYRALRRDYTLIARIPRWDHILAVYGLCVSRPKTVTVGTCTL